MQVFRNDNNQSENSTTQTGTSFEIKQEVSRMFQLLQWRQHSKRKWDDRQTPTDADRLHTGLILTSIPHRHRQTDDVTVTADNKRQTDDVIVTADDSNLPSQAWQARKMFGWVISAERWKARFKVFTSHVGGIKTGGSTAKNRGRAKQNFLGVKKGVAQFAC